jgi:hypothetical protein
MAGVIAPTLSRDQSMHRRMTAATFALAALLVAGLGMTSGFAQPGPLLPGFKPPPMAPIKPYPAVAVTPPAPFSDPGFISLRKELADAAAHKDRATLAKLVWPQIFWIQDKDLADKKKSGIDNLAKAVDLDAKDGSGWDILAGFANEPTAMELPQQKGVICAPADPTIDPAALEALGKATQTDPSEWGYPLEAAPNAPVIEKLGMNLVRVLPDSGAGADPHAPLMLHVAAPSGKAGFIDAQALAPLGGDQMCYAKDGNGWKIAGYLGGAAP